MNTSAEVLLKWGDGEYLFKLRIKEIDELQRVCGAGFGEIATRLMHGRPYYRDVYDTIRLGLIGGGTAPVKAKELVEMYVDGRPMADLKDPSSPLKTAMAVINAKWFGIADLIDDADTSPGNVDAATTMDESTLPQSTAKVQSSGGRRRRSKK